VTEPVEAARVARLRSVLDGLARRP